MGAAVSVTGLVVRYGAVEALRGVTFDVPPGSIFGLLGPNGGGKTTLFRVLATLLPPSAGRGTVAGFDVVADAASVRKSLGVVFQSPSLDKVLSVRANLRCQAALYGLRGAERDARIDAMLDRLGLRDKARAAVKTLSGGQKRRVEIAKGTLHAPSVLLLDEPTTGLDPGARRAVWDWLREMRAGGATCVVTTHLMEEAETCDRVVILDEGRLVAQGSPDELRASIGADVVTIEASDPTALLERITARFGVGGTADAGVVRLEIADGARRVADLMGAFGEDIASVRVGRPTLEDVFIKLTGRRLAAS